MNLRDGLFFDMDGVLVDVTNSYRVAIARTVAHFLGRPISQEVIQAYKDRGGFNDDWRLTATILRDHGIRVSKRSVVRRFQSLYHGECHDGLILNESWMMDRKLLAAISRRWALAIVTDRPRKEALFALNRFDVEMFFPVLVAGDDVAEGDRKPQPRCLLRAVALSEARGGFFFGDGVDDMMSARAAGLVPVAVIPPGPNREWRRRRMVRCGAIRVIDHIDRLEEVLHATIQV